MNNTFKFLFLVGAAAVSANIFAEAEAVEVRASEATEAAVQEVHQDETVEPVASGETVTSEKQEQFGFTTNKDADTEAVFLSLRMGVLDSYDVVIKDDPTQFAPETAVDDTFTGSSVGFRIGYLLGKWRTYLEYTPAAELTVDEAAIEVESYTLATDYSVWRSENREHRVSLGGYASDLTIEHTIDTSGVGFSGPKADGFAYGLSAAYRYDFLEWLFLGADFRYGLNGVSGDDSKNVNYLSMKSEGSTQFNLEVGVYF